MKVTIASIGNSKGVRIPKVVLEQCHIKKEAEMEVKGKSIIIRACKEEPRKDWEQAFRKMRENKDDQLIIDDNIDLEMEQWEWK
ncbi:MAG: AbrB/MazE/SpoVT family DNA-binding domain-containing protein [Candidatus Omnitrophica bacterium]|nr:AbrB/MazE/SpoVT family DNA-binding domain-containing protein [Candidatus Omnitrophota bacterium]MBU4477527.1 AbrB/MazE/SpoVT family DNA-binding domain-containing protein [Candidatus Omnitrophota bacterium]